jgi:hypothetical protein
VLPNPPPPGLPRTESSVVVNYQPYPQPATPMSQSAENSDPPQALLAAHHHLCSCSGPNLFWLPPQRPETSSASHPPAEIPESPLGFPSVVPRDTGGGEGQCGLYNIARLVCPLSANSWLTCARVSSVWQPVDVYDIVAESRSSRLAG